jgi:adenine-specific DNA-methyltransferase
MFVAGVVNSKIAMWFAKHVFATKQGGFYDFEPRYSSQWPIPSATPNQKASIEDLVRRLLAAKKNSEESIVSTLEREIDVQVYALYSLTSDEIKIVEETAL